MGKSGKWTFEFKYNKKDSLKVRKYQEILLQIRQEFEPQFAQMNPEEGKAEWTTRTDGKAPPDNMFAQFTYKCTKVHTSQGPEHGKWTLLWNPKKADIKNHLHARCAPTLFKDLSNKIQKKLSKEFHGYFEVKWENGISGYESGSRSRYGFASGGGDGSFGDDDDDEGMDFNRLVEYMTIANKWDDSDSDENERCPHHLPWSYCCDCCENIIDMHDNGIYF